MATPMSETFGVWLTEKLTSVSSDIDTDVFVSFIIGILDTGDDNEEKLDSIGGLLEGVMEPEKASEVSKNILDEWMAVSEKTKENEATSDIGDKLSKIMEGHTIATIKERQLTAEEKSRKEAILKQYAEVSDEEETDDEFEDESESTNKQESSDGLLVKNINKQSVEKNMREARAKSKQESEVKKEKNKQDRQAQKEKADERKQSEKKRTQKGERRR